MKQFFTYIILLSSALCFSQKTLEKLLNKHNSDSIPYIAVNVLDTIQNQVVLLDAREVYEYKTSHLKNAIHIGYDFFNLEEFKEKVPEKNSKVVVYCSLGIRSEDIAFKLKKAGYNNVQNLYGGIFEWKNNNLPVYNSNEKQTDSVHVFSKAWGKWLKKGIKVYE
ncbi:rhodanese-like domain-containing protein [Flavisericum labens]|uniref:rhodanese-like domain-containing protein n=1 Tax=Flavisericum labens TaxID=3377112 RepID=UPI00387B512E